MTQHRPAPDWRTRVAGRPAPYAAPRTGSRPLPLRVVGTVTSEAEAPWLARAGGTRLVLVSALVGLVVALAITGQLVPLVLAVVVLLLPLLVVLVMLFVLAGMVPGGRFLAGGMVGAGLRRAGSARLRAAISSPGRQLTVASGDGLTEEVLVASSRRLPAGTAVSAYGPRVLGRRHAWLVRPHHGGLVVARGVAGAALVAPACALVAVALLLGGLL